MIVPHMPVWPAAQSWGLSPAKRDEDSVVFSYCSCWEYWSDFPVLHSKTRQTANAPHYYQRHSPPHHQPVSHSTPPHLTFLTFALSSSSFSLLCQLQTSLFSSKGNSQWEERVAVLEQWLLIKLPSVWKWPSRCWVSWFSLRTWTLNYLRSWNTRRLQQSSLFFFPLLTCDGN